MKKVYIMIAAVTFVVGFVLGAVLILARVTKRLECCCEDGDMEELYRIDGANACRSGFAKKNQVKNCAPKCCDPECEEEDQ